MVSRDRIFFEELCGEYYEKILKYLNFSLMNESLARECTQDVFLVACQKAALLRQHPNPGGFLFQTAKNLAQKSRREIAKNLLSDIAEDLADPKSSVRALLDSRINELDYVDTVIEKLSEEKQRLYRLYYVEKRPMAEIAALSGIEEPALRMRYVRLRREIKNIITEVSEENFGYI